MEAPKVADVFVSQVRFAACANFWAITDFSNLLDYFKSGHEFSGREPFHLGCKTVRRSQETRALLGRSLLSFENAPINLVRVQGWISILGWKKFTAFLRQGMLSERRGWPYVPQEWQIVGTQHTR